MLTDSGLQRVSDVHFKLSPDASEKTITEWISTYREMLQQSFLLTGNMGNTPYCLDEIRIEQSCDDEPDWFELHITIIFALASASVVLISSKVVPPSYLPIFMSNMITRQAHFYFV